MTHTTSSVRPLLSSVYAQMPGCNFYHQCVCTHLNGGRGLARGALQTSEKTIQEQKSCSQYVVDDFNAAVGTNCSGDGGTDLMALVTKLKTENLFEHFVCVLPCPWKFHI
uniref:Endo/exonuclease/phosphatase domain-containing protein n=1 Tax=Haemonchus contortus TaxID=6289 RepID=A0A7I5E7S4_HAECO